MNIFITGVSTGIGRELVKKLVTEGHTVWGIARDNELLTALEKEVGKKRFFYTVCDVSNKRDVVKTMKAIKRKSFQPDVIILNAAVYSKDLVPLYNTVSISKAFAINFFGALIWIEQFLPVFLSRDGGHVVAISSTSAFRPDPQSLSLPSSKAALSMAFRSLRLRFATEKIIFGTVHFGPVATAISPNYTSSTGAPKYPFVLTPKEAAENIQQVMRERKSKDYFFPFFPTFIFRLLLCIPDAFFAKFSIFLKR